MLRRAACIAMLALAATLSAGADDLRNLIEKREDFLSQQQLQTVVEYLKQHPAAANAEITRLYGTGTNTPLNEALSLGDVGLVSVLLEHGADPNKASGQIQASPLQWALNDTIDPAKIAESVALLIAKGADPNLSDQRDSTSLDTWAARRSWCQDPSYVRIGVMLLEAGALIEGDPNAPGTPLMVATINSNPVAVKMLLDQGADPDREALLGTARSLAENEAQNGTPEASQVLALIKKH